MKNENKSNNAVIYCRVSTREQVEEGNSLISQERNCQEYAAKHGYTVIQTFIERGESAKTAERTELQKLLTYCAVKKHNISAIIIYKIDRLSRNTDDYSQLRILLKKYGVEIRSTSEFFENTPAGRFMENIIANVAQFDNDVRTERSVGGLKQAVLEGRYVWSAPMGYSNGKIGGKSNLIVNEKAPLIFQIYKEVASGMYTVEEVRHRIARKGLLQKNGKPISKSNLYRILSNQLYTGWITTFGERIKGTFEPIINAQLFERVQKQIRSKKISRNYIIENKDFPLRRFVLSATGEKITGSWSQGRNKKYAYYRFIKEGTLFPVTKLDNKFSEFFNSHSISPKYFERIKHLVRDTFAEQSQKRQLAIQELTKQQNALEIKKKNLIEKNLNDIISDSTLNQQLKMLEDEEWNIHQSIERQQTKAIDIISLFEQVTDFVTKPGKTWAKLPFEIKKKTQWFVFPKGVRFSGNRFRTIEIRSIFKLKELFESNISLKVGSAELYYKQPKYANSPAYSEKRFIRLVQSIEPDLHDLVKILSDI